MISVLEEERSEGGVSLPLDPLSQYNYRSKIYIENTQKRQRSSPVLHICYIVVSLCNTVHVSQILVRILLMWFKSRLFFQPIMLVFRTRCDCVIALSKVLHAVK